MVLIKMYLNRLLVFVCKVDSSIEHQYQTGEIVNLVLKQLLSQIPVCIDLISLLFVVCHASSLAFPSLNSLTSTVPRIVVQSEPCRAGALVAGNGVCTFLFAQSLLHLTLVQICKNKHRFFGIGNCFTIKVHAWLVSSSFFYNILYSY